MTTACTFLSSKTRAHVVVTFGTRSFFKGCQAVFVGIAHPSNLSQFLKLGEVGVRAPATTDQRDFQFGTADLPLPAVREAAPQQPWPLHRQMFSARRFS